MSHAVGCCRKAQRPLRCVLSSPALPSPLVPHAPRRKWPLPTVRVTRNRPLTRPLPTRLPLSNQLPYQPREGSKVKVSTVQPSSRSGPRPPLLLRVSRPHLLWYPRPTLVNAPTKLLPNPPRLGASRVNPTAAKLLPHLPPTTIGQVSAPPPRPPIDLTFIFRQYRPCRLRRSRQEDGQTVHLCLLDSSFFLRPTRGIRYRRCPLLFRSVITTDNLRSIQYCRTHFIGMYHQHHLEQQLGRKHPNG